MILEVKSLLFQPHLCNWIPAGLGAFHALSGCQLVTFPCWQQGGLTLLTAVFSSQNQEEQAANSQHQTSLLSAPF